MKFNSGLLAFLMLASVLVVSAQDRFLLLHSGSAALTPISLVAGDEL